MLDRLTWVLFRSGVCLAIGWTVIPWANSRTRATPAYAGAPSSGERTGALHASRVPSPALAELTHSAVTRIDLSNSFVPNVLAEESPLGETSAPAYAATYRALADERQDGKGLEHERDPSAKYLELYGISPNLRVLRERMLDVARHACHQQIDASPLQSYAGQLSMGPASAGAGPRSQARRAAVSVVQSILRCERLLAASHTPGVFDFGTSTALRAFQRKNMIVAPAIVDATTRQALLKASPERDFESLLRALRERVVAATHLIEDGSASGDVAPVVGRVLEARELRGTGLAPGLEHGAPDLIGRATDAAARALGWTSAEAARAWLAEVEPHALETLSVSLPLPSLPRYHTQQMALRAEIDRGDVWYAYPFRPDGTRLAQPVERRPTLVLYVSTPDGEIPLVRWGTTIGGFQPEMRADGRVVFRYKNSEVGPGIWRDVIAAPTWLPPASTPDAELVRRIGPDRYALKRELFGPGYASAYGMVMMRHEVPVSTPAQEGEELGYLDRGVRTHGSVNYSSILSGQSHGCHRLFNHLALRLAAFLIAHRDHVRRGALPVRYARTGALPERA
jgi:hypothetical protein